MKHLSVNFHIFLLLCVPGIGMNSHAGECSGTTSDLKYADDACRKNKQFVLDAVRKNGRELKFVPPAMQDDEEVVEAALMVPDTVNVFEYASPRLKRDAKFILKVLEKNKTNCCMHLLGSADATLRNDKKFMMKVLAIKENVFRYAGDSLKKDKEFALYAINHEKYPVGYGSVFPQLDITLRNDIEIARAGMKRYEGAYKDLGDKLKQNRELALAALKWGPFMWKDVPQSLKDDLSFVQEAATVNPEVINYMEEKLKQDKTIVLIASRNSNKSETLVKGGFRKDKDVVLVAIEKSDGALPLLLDESFQNDEDFIRSAIRKNGGALRYAPVKFIQDKEIILAAVRNSGIALAFAGKSHQQDKDIVMTAVKQNGLALAYAGKTLRSDPDIVYAAAKQNSSSLIYAEQDIASQTGRKLGVQINSESVIGEPSLLSEHFRVDSSVLTSDGKRLYVLKNGVLSQYQISPFKLLSSFKTGIDTVKSIESKERYRIFITSGEKKLVIYDRSSIRLFDLTSRYFIQSISHDSQNALLVDNVFITFGPDNILTLWSADTLQKIKSIKSNYQWTGARVVQHDEGSTFLDQFSLDKWNSSVFRLGDRIVIFIPAYLASHAGARGDLFLVNKDTFKLETRITHLEESPILAFDHKSLFVRGLKSVEPRKESARVEIGTGFDLHNYDIETGNVRVVKPEEFRNINTTPLLFRMLNSNIPPAGQFHLVSWQGLASPGSKDDNIFLYVYENGEAVLFNSVRKTYELTENARMYLRMKVPEGVIPVNDATFDKFVISNGSRQQ